MTVAFSSRFLSLYFLVSDLECLLLSKQKPTPIHTPSNETMAHKNAPAHHVGGGGGAHDEDSVRMDAILKIDPNALLKTISDLEHRLTEYQRQDKAPAWAIALENRLEKIEKNRASTPMGASSGSSLDDPGSSGGQVTLASLAADDRILSRVRKEMESKLGSQMIHFESLLSSQNLELERLHKLLTIRPTTSELQQIMVAVNAVEQKSHSQIHDLQNLLQSTLRDRVAEEMGSIVTELKSSRSSSEEGHKLIYRQVNEYSTQIAEIREGAQNSFRTIEQSLAQVKEDIRKSTEMMFSIKANVDEELTETKKQLYEVQKEMRNTVDLLHEHKRMADESLAKMDEFMKFEMKRLEKALNSTDDKVGTLQNSLIDLESEFVQYKDESSRDIAELKADTEKTFSELDRQQQRMNTVQNMVEEFNKLDFPGKLAKQDERMNKTQYELAELQNTVQNLITNDIKGINAKIGVLQEQCNVRIPALFSESSLRADKLQEGLKNAFELHEHLRQKLSATDELVDSLCPLQERVQSLFESKEKHDEELTELKLGLTSSMDANSECARRLDELEETIDSLDDTITARLNKIRDNLMENLVEKQSETHAQVKNVKENLEVMSQHGDHGGGGRGGRDRKAGGLIKGSGDDHSGSSSRNGSLGASLADANRRTNYKAPGVQGQVIQGDHLGGSSVPQSQPPSARASFMGPGQGGHGSYGQHGGYPPRNGSMMGHPNGGGGMQHAMQQGMMQAGYGPGGKRLSNQISRTNSNYSVPDPGPHQVQSISEDAPNLGSNDGGGQQVPASFSADMDGNGQHYHGPEGGEVHGQMMMYNGGGPDMGSPQGDGYYSPQAGGPYDGGGYGGGYDNQSYGSNNTYSTRGGINKVSVNIPSVNGAPPGNRQDMLANEYGQLINAPNSVATYGNKPNPNYIHFNEAQFIADLCVNYEEISVKKKRVTNIPPVLCQNIAEVTAMIAEAIANAADFEMVELAMAAVAGSLAVTDLKYDENFVVNRRQQKVEEFLDLTTSLVSNTTNQVGMIRLDARTLFFSLLKKALEMFLTKHNQVCCYVLSCILSIF